MIENLITFIVLIFLLPFFKLGRWHTSSQRFLVYTRGYYRGYWTPLCKIHRRRTTLKAYLREWANKKEYLKMQEIIAIQCSDGNWNYDPYMHGMANGMIYANSLFLDLEPKFLDSPKMWLTEKLFQVWCDTDCSLEKDPVALCPDGTVMQFKSGKWVSCNSRTHRVQSSAFGLIRLRTKPKKIVYECQSCGRLTTNSEALDGPCGGEAMYDLHKNRINGSCMGVFSRIT
jgi:hypothetical protein